jgi:preprotein translocase subunit SecA
MAFNIFNKLFGSRNDRQLKRMSRAVARINDLEAGIADLSDEALRAKTDEFRQRLVDGETLDDLLPEAFAVVREAARRALGLRHYDVQSRSTNTWRGVTPAGWARYSSFLA